MISSEEIAFRLALRATTRLGMPYTPRKVWNVRKTEYQTPQYKLIKGVPVVRVDPNNEAVYCWAALWRYTQQPARLIRIDAYDDMITKDERLRPSLPEGKDIRTATLEEIFRYAHHLGFASFLEPAVQRGLIHPMVNVFNPHNEQFGRYRYETEPYRHFRVLSPSEAKDANRGLENLPLVVDIDLVSFSSLRDLSHAHGLIDKRIASAEMLLRACREKPVCITLAQSRTPIPYVPANTLGYVRDKTFEMVERVIRGTP